MDAEALTRRLEARALELGFDAMGVAPAGDADPQRFLRIWLERGHAAGMTWLAETRAEREDARALMPEARSVVVLAASYYWPTPGERPVVRPGAPATDHPGPRIARYARGADYHAVLRRRVRKLRRALLGWVPGARVYPTVDTSPVLERAWAARSGVGWIGKSTMSLHPRLGSYTLLAGLLTDLELVPTPPLEDRCGSCTRCLDACPTGAFVGPYELDARRCITYWNVEHVGPIPAEAPPLHGWLAGCDVCQEVCPWNKFARPARDARFEPRPELVTPDLDAFARDPNHVERAIAGTALQRTGAESLMRSARRLLEEGAS